MIWVMLDHKCCRAESDYTADVCRRQAFRGDRKGKMKWKRSPGSAVIPFSLSFTPPPFSFLCHAGRSVSSQRNELFMTWRLNGKVKEDLRQVRMRQTSLSLCALHFSRSSPLQTRLACHSDWSGARFIILIITRILVDPSYWRVLAVPLIHHDRGDLAS